MKKTEAAYMDCMVMNCPYCELEVIETLSYLTDWDGGAGPDEGETEIECPHCRKSFIYYFSEE